ncbi:MAG TPA: T9SS type A sorting domain-containing protein, partial [Bacteroidales bacterium]|nr:T9SS type A sorting domain-containing protein [Bacteroidales bacterium]
TLLFSGDLKNYRVVSTALSDSFGTGKKIQIIADTKDDKINLEQNFYVYTGKSYLLTEFSINSSSDLYSNYMAPVYSDSTLEILPPGDNKTIWTPFDNDKWVRYQALNFGVPVNSYEVSAMVNNTTRKGFITGSVEHNSWKTGIRISTSVSNKLKRLEVYGGVTSNETRDVLPHGMMKGKLIKSPLVMVGYFDDWRKGMETYADVNANIAQKLPWLKGKPFGWNSWGAIQTNLSYDNASEVSEFFANNLQNNNFQNDSTVYIGLDSYWDNITYSNLIKFVQECKNRGQHAGIYWTPFVDWAKNPNRLVEGTSDVYYRDIYLYANGKPQEIAGAYAVDPTNPATKARIDLYLNRFISEGFTYLKLDFMTHGSLEADSHYDSTIFTGMQAYNQGLKYIADYLHGRMFLNLSISPLFPAQYAHSRRIACDAYGSIENTEYTLNSLTYGWWLDHVYSYNDADNIVLNGFSNGENRARVTSSVITGIVIAGDDLSANASSTAKLRAETFLTNKEVDRIARQTKAFYPIEMAEGSKADDMFMQTAGDTVYLAIFNYASSGVTKFIDFSKIGLSNGKNYVFHDLWEDTKELHTDSWNVDIGRKDVKLFKIYEGILEPSNINPHHNNSLEAVYYPNPCNELLNINFPEEHSDIFAYDIDGKIVKVIDHKKKQINTGDLKSGLYLFSMIDKSGNKVSRIIIKN